VPSAIAARTAEVVEHLAKGWLKVSHRKKDEARSTKYTVKHTHLRADHAPLKNGEIVPVEIIPRDRWHRNLPVSSRTPETPGDVGRSRR
jgi:hypothetical protein